MSVLTLISIALDYKLYLWRNNILKLSVIARSKMLINSLFMFPNN